MTRAAFVIGFGYFDEGDEGFLYSVPRPNTVPLVRWTNFNGATADLRTSTPRTAKSHPARGWFNEGVVGYTCE